MLLNLTDVLTSSLLDLEDLFLGQIDIVTPPYLR